MFVPDVNGIVDPPGVTRESTLNPLDQQTKKLLYCSIKLHISIAFVMSKYFKISLNV